VTARSRPGTGVAPGTFDGFDAFDDFGTGDAFGASVVGPSSGWLDVSGGASNQDAPMMFPRPVSRSPANSLVTEL